MTKMIELTENIASLHLYFQRDLQLSSWHYDNIGILFMMTS